MSDDPYTLFGHTAESWYADCFSSGCMSLSICRQRSGSFERIIQSLLVYSLVRQSLDRQYFVEPTDFASGCWLYIAALKLLRSVILSSAVVSALLFSLP